MAMSKILDYLAQPDGVTCQSACVAMLTGQLDVMAIRRSLLDLGEPGNPYVMGEYLKPRVTSYDFSDRSSIAEMVDWLQQGFTLCSHGYFTGSGHVILLSGHKNDCFFADDPWGEFSASGWTYSDNENGDDLPYSEKLIYAACVMGRSKSESQTIYQAGGCENPNGIWRTFKNAWVHRIKN